MHILIFFDRIGEFFGRNYAIMPAILSPGLKYFVNVSILCTAVAWRVANCSVESKNMLTQLLQKGVCFLLLITICTRLSVTACHSADFFLWLNSNWKHVVCFTVM